MKVSKSEINILDWRLSLPLVQRQFVDKLIACQRGDIVLTIFRQQIREDAHTIHRALPTNLRD
jgi:hypothetical protein